MSEALQENMQEELAVRTDLEAGWQLERRRKIIEDRDELIAFYKERIKAVEEDADWKLGFIDRALRGFCETVPHKATKTQEYYLLPGGQIMMKEKKASTRIIGAPQVKDIPKRYNAAAMSCRRNF